MVTSTGYTADSCGVWLPKPPRRAPFSGAGSTGASRGGDGAEGVRVPGGPHLCVAPAFSQPLLVFWVWFMFWFQYVRGLRSGGSWLIPGRRRRGPAGRTRRSPGLTPSQRLWPCCRRAPAAAGGWRGRRTPGSLLCPGRSPCGGRRGRRRERQGTAGPSRPQDPPERVPALGQTLTLSARAAAEAFQLVPVLSAISSQCQRPGTLRTVLAITSCISLPAQVTSLAAVSMVSAPSPQLICKVPQAAPCCVPRAWTGASNVAS